MELLAVTRRSKTLIGYFMNGGEVGGADGGGPVAQFSEKRGKCKWNSNPWNRRLDLDACISFCCLLMSYCKDSTYKKTQSLLTLLWVGVWTQRIWVLCPGPPGLRSSPKQGSSSRLIQAVGRIHVTGCRTDNPGFLI